MFQQGKDAGLSGVIGGEGAVSADIASELAAYGTVTRVSGKSRYETNLAMGMDEEIAAEKAIKDIESLGQDKLPVCVAKTQYSLSDDPTKLGKPENFMMTVREVKLSAGAGFIVCLTGDIMTMPGLPKVPAAYKIDVDNEGKIDGLF